MKIKLRLLKNLLVVYRLSKGQKIPLQIFKSPFFSITKTSEEISIVCDEKIMPKKVKFEKGWRCLKVLGPLDFSLTGILASLSAPLAKKKISIFAISTFDTDYLLVKKEKLKLAISVLKKEGFTFIN